MKDVITSIIQAEEMAKQIVDEATAKASEMAILRDEESEKIKAQAVINMGVERKSKLEKAQIKAQEKYDKEYAVSEKKAKILEESVTDKIKEVANALVSEIVK